MVVRHLNFVRVLALPAEAEPPRVALLATTGGNCCKVLHFLVPKGKTSGRKPVQPLVGEVEPMVGIEPTTYGLRIRKCTFATVREKCITTAC